VNYPLVTPSKESAHAANVIAAVLSLVIPGSGQIYKGQFTSGLVWMFVGIPLAIWIGILLSLATAGLGLILPVLCWVGQAVGAYFVVDLRRRRHHHLAEPTIYDDYD
jgi:TM2 domain-containing membrane protein YozV